MHVNSPLALLLLQVAVVVLVGRVLARGVRRLGQPSVVAEVIAGIVLGPSLLGAFFPGAMAWLFPDASMAGLSLVAKLGLVFFMFLVGMEFDTGLLRGKGHQSVVISHASIAAPFALGFLIAVPMHTQGQFAPDGVAFLPFALFLGAAMSVTAFPVLARILAESGVLRTPLGAIALSCAAVDDVTAWCILAFVVSIARADGVVAGLTTTGLAAAFVAVVFWGVRPLLRRLGPREGQAMSADTVAIAFFALLVAAATTEAIGIHALFGAFLLGAVMPRTGGLTHALTEKIEDLVTIVLLPLFFAYSGLRTKLGLLDSWNDWAWCGGIVIVACAGKFGGSALAARFVGLRWREASAIGVLMNTRGLMELIVLNVGLDLGVLTPRLFTMMVIMALVTTWITSPLLEWIYPREQILKELVPVATDPSPVAEAPVLVCVSDPAIVPALIEVARLLVPDGAPLLALHVVRPDRMSTCRATPPDTLGEDNPLQRTVEQATALGVSVRTLSFVADDPARDIVRVAEAKAARLVLLGVHRPLLGEGPFGGVVGRVLAECSVDVAVLVDGGLDQVREVAYMADDDAAVADVRGLLTRSGVGSGVGQETDTLLVAPIGTSVQEGRTALLVRPRPPA